MREILEEAVIMNAVYFNTKDVEALENTEKFNEIKGFCIQKTKELIYDIVQPENVLHIGSDGKTALIMHKNIENIKHYIIHHTSMNFKFYTDECINLRKEKFEELLLK